MAPVKHKAIIAEMKATIETMRSQYTDLLLDLQQAEAELAAAHRVAHRNAKLALGFEAALAALRARWRDVGLSP